MEDKEQENKKSKKRLIVLIFGVFFFLLLAVFLTVGIFFIWTGKEKKAELKGLAQRLLEKPVEISMEKGRKKLALQPEEKPKEILVDDFDVGLTSGIFSERKNRLGSYQGTWAMRPSFAIITKSSEIRRGDTGQSLVIDYRKEAGWAGWYTLLNDIDITPYNTLSFWVRGANGGEKFDIGLADSRMQELQIDAFFLGSVNSFIQDGFVSKEWKQVRVPLARASSEISLSKMGSLVFWFRQGGQGRIYVEDIKFTNDPEVKKIEEYNTPRAEKDLLHPRAMWVWKIDPVSKVRQRREMLQFCRTANISVLYLFFPEFTEAPPADYFKSLAEFMKESHQSGIKVEALTGNPTWSLAENHHLVLNWIKFFLEYNKARPKDEHVDGVSLDVEPYLTAEWEQDKERIKADYIELLRKCRELVNSYGQDFRLGVAIPFFYDVEDEGRFERSILDYVDYIALMDYYDTAEEIIDRAKFHINLAKEANKRVIIAVETQDLVEMHQGKRRNTFIEEGWEEMERQLDKVKQVFLFEASFEGFAIHHYDSYKLMTRGRNVPTKERLQNPYIVKAVPRSGDIKIDGTLDGWDLAAPCEITDERNIVYGSGAWTGKNDLSFKIYANWDDEALYFACDVTDDIFIQEWRGADMWQGDHAEVWLDTDISGDINEAVNSADDFQFGISPGNFVDIPPEVHIWTPALPKELNYKELIKVAASRTPHGYIVEARIPQEVLFYYGQVSRVGVESVSRGAQAETIFQLPSDVFLGLHKGFRMGIMADVGDTDDKANPQKSLMSTSVNRVWGDPTTFGVLELE
ncbi:MAG: hypothetical protein NTV07_01725 [Candidatus Omnitrophica bacterium]|nr:hypothetical protein [Candidatus Omnitrophota bacterium]